MKLFFFLPIFQQTAHESTGIFLGLIKTFIRSKNDKPSDKQIRSKIV